MFDILRRIVDLIFSNGYLASPRPTFGHYWGVSLTNSILIFALKQLWPDVNGNLIARLGGIIIIIIIITDLFIVDNLR